MMALPMLRRGEEGSLPALRACWDRPSQAVASSMNATVPPKPIRRQKADGTGPSARASVEDRRRSAKKTRDDAASSQDTQAVKRRVGRPSRITRNRHNLLMTCLQLGQSRRVAADTVGISTSTITRAMQRDPLFAADIAYAEDIGVLFRRHFAGWVLEGRCRKGKAAPANTAEKRRLQNTRSLRKGTPDVAKMQPVSRPGAK